MSFPLSFERTHIHNKEPVRYFTPSTVGQHLGRSPSELIKAFQPGGIEQLQVGDYIYKPTASRPGPQHAAAESGLDKMEPIQQARKKAGLPPILAAKVKAAAALGRAMANRTNPYDHHSEDWTPEGQADADAAKTDWARDQMSDGDGPIKEAEKYHDYVGRGKAWNESKSAQEWEAKRQAVIKNETIASEGIHSKGEQDKPVKEAAKSAKIELTPEQKATGRLSHQIAKDPALRDTTRVNKPSFKDDQPVKKAAEDTEKDREQDQKYYERQEAEADNTIPCPSCSEGSLPDPHCHTCWGKGRVKGDDDEPIKKGVNGRENERTGESESDFGPGRSRKLTANDFKFLDPNDDDRTAYIKDPKARAEHVAAEKPVKKAADSFDEEEWTGRKPLDKPAPDHEAFVKTGEVSQENQKNYGGFWQSMKDRLKFAAKEKTEQDLADEKQQEYLGRQMGRERLPGYEDWTGRGKKPGQQPNSNDKRDPEVQRRDRAIDSTLAYKKK